MGRAKKHHLQHGFPKTCQLTSMSNLLHVILQNHELLSLVTVSEAATISWKVTQLYPALCSSHTSYLCWGDPTRGRWMPAREKRVKREDKHKKVFCHVSWRCWGYCVLRNARSRLPWQNFFLGFPFYFSCFPEEQLLRAPCLPQISPFPQRYPPSSCQNYRFLTLLVLHVRPVWRIFLFSSPVCSRPFKGIKSPSALQPENNSIPFSISSFLWAWPCGKRKENPIWKSQTATTSHLVGRTRKKLCGNFQFLNCGFYLPIPKFLCLLYGLSLCERTAWGKDQRLVFQENISPSSF